MANPKFYDRVYFSTATTGTGDITVGSAVAGYRTPAQASIPDGTTVTLVFEDGTDREESDCVYTASTTTFTRTLVFSTTGALLNLSGSAKAYSVESARWIANKGIANSFSGIQTFLGGSYTLDFAYIDASYSTAQIGWYIAQMGVNRWALVKDNDTESGSNAGSSLVWYRCSDAGAVLGTPISVNRATGKLTLETTPYVGTDALALAKKVVQTFTASGTYTPTTGARSARITVIGGGASGGSSAGATNNAGAGSGGGAGGTAIKWLDLSTLTGSATVTVGAGGAAPTAGNNAGNAGVTSSFAGTGIATISAPGGGAGGASGAAGTTVVGVAGGAESSAPTGGDVNLVGAGGYPSWRLSGTQAMAGQGGASFFGGGGRAPAATGGGGAASPYGAGGAGGLSIGNTNSAGGAGKAGIVMVEEFF